MPSRFPAAASWAPPDRGWTYLASGDADGVTNMATDLALMRAAAASGVPVLRTYGWTVPTVSFGRNERIGPDWSRAALAARGLDVVRRPTGGRALVHGRDVTYAVALPLPRTVPWREAYDAVNARLLVALQSLGVPATLVPARAREGGAARASASPSAAAAVACFGGADEGELLASGAKLVGSAVWRDATAFLQHGTILLENDQSLLPADRPAVAPALATVRDWQPHLTDADVCAALREAFDARTPLARGEDAFTRWVEDARAEIGSAAWFGRR